MCTVAAACGGSIIAEATTGVNPIKNVVGEENFNAITAISTGGTVIGTSTISSYVGSSGGISSSGATSKDVSRGSTGRIEPANLTEKLAMEQVKSNPSAGKILEIQMNDPRWPASEGWVKMQQIVPTSRGNINIHYVYNQTINIFDDFKFRP